MTQQKQILKEEWFVVRTKNDLNDPAVSYLKYETLSVQSIHGTKDLENYTWTYDLLKGYVSDTPVEAFDLLKKYLKTSTFYDILTFNFRLHGRMSYVGASYDETKAY